MIIGCKVFKATSGPVSKMLIQLILTCTGGGILVPIFLNGVPVSFFLMFLSNNHLKICFTNTVLFVDDMNMIQLFIQIIGSNGE